MIKRKLQVWEPIKDMGDMELVNFNVVGKVNITLEDKHREYSFLYDKRINGNFVLACRFTHEMKKGDLVPLVVQAQQEYFVSATRPWSTYKMTNSDFIQWYDSLPGPGSNDIHIEHHIFATSDYTIEVLSEYEPKINITDK
ncbi:hypothetical protein [Alkalihalobacillus sp. AL-G]|uniref:hypothetical protein n=1 Tax=Alkalihalobacillus sp. AL-G TaxID=2926399 RepID=UPI00272DC1BA|nr:hypothetical protein [Alkalihalobacillus sp. AL-G]WLD92710.1 hypothetical protein MOJ78_17110 [Alkalihalobacillus sp. AL-G]